MQLSSELLHRAEEKRRILMSNLVAAEEEQRRRIAVDVHDDSIQAMAAVSLRLQVLRRSAPSREFADKITDIEQAVVTAVGRLRRLLFQLGCLPRAFLELPLIFGGEVSGFAP